MISPVSENYRFSQKIPSLKLFSPRQNSGIKKGSKTEKKIAIIESPETDTFDRNVSQSLKQLKRFENFEIFTNSYFPNRLLNKLRFTEPPKDLHFLKSKDDILLNILRKSPTSVTGIERYPIKTPDLKLENEDSYKFLCASIKSKSVKNIKNIQVIDKIIENCKNFQKIKTRKGKTIKINDFPKKKLSKTEILKIESNIRLLEFKKI